MKINRSITDCLISNRLIICFFLLLVSHSVLLQDQSDTIEEKARRFQEMLKHDGVKRTVPMTEKNYASLIKKKGVVVSLFQVQQSTDSAQSSSELVLLEVAAQVFSGRVLCTVCNIAEHPQVMQQADVKYSGVIKIYNNGRPSMYHGQRSPDVMVPYVSKLFETTVNKINSKTEKKQFDKQDLSKVVAYVSYGSKEWKVLESVALYFQPMIPFYAVSDAKIAKTLHLKKKDSLLLVKPFEKPIPLPSKVDWNEKAIFNFISSNKRELLQKLRLENIHEVWAVDTHGYVAPVFAASRSADGKRFLSLSKALAKTYKTNNNISFIWIDPDTLPMMGKYWLETFNIESSKPTIGAIDVASQKAAWLAVENVGEKSAASRLKEWVDDLLAGIVPLTPLKNEDAQPDSAQATHDDDDDLGTAAQEGPKDEL